VRILRHSARPRPRCHDHGGAAPINTYFSHARAEVPTQPSAGGAQLRGVGAAAHSRNSAAATTNRMGMGVHIKCFIGTRSRKTVMRLTFAPILVCACSLVAGCAMSYEVMKMGPDGYLATAVATPARGGIDAAHEKAAEAASETCQSLGKSRIVTSINTVHEPAIDRAVMAFTCS